MNNDPKYFFFSDQASALGAIRKPKAENITCFSSEGMYEFHYTLS